MEACQICLSLSEARSSACWVDWALGSHGIGFASSTKRGLFGLVLNVTAATSYSRTA